MFRKSLTNFRSWIFGKVELFFMKAFRLLRRLSYASNGKVFIQDATSSLSSSLSLSNFGIVITTFEPRFKLFAIPLIKSIRSISEIPISVIINGNYDGPAEKESLKNFLREISQFDFVFPVSFCDMRGCSELWNTGIKHLNKEISLVLNDDIHIEEKTFLTDLESILTKLDKFQLITINGSWSHFLIHRDLFDEIGMFDERFLGFGWEDADYKLRYLRKFKRQHQNLNVTSFVNIIDQSHDSNVETGLGKYSLFNREYYLTKYPEQRDGAILDTEIQAPFPNLDFDNYDVDAFRRKFYPLLKEHDSSTISDEITLYLNSKTPRV